MIEPEAPRTNGVWRASLSTMWIVKRDEPFDSFFPRCFDLGFSHQELNHSVTEEMLASVDPAYLRISSVHEPSPCNTPRKVRQAEGIHISAVDERLRSTAVKWLRGSIRCAAKLGASSVVVHSGEVPVGKDLEQRMLALIADGGPGSEERSELKRRFEKVRSEAAAPHLDAVRRSLLEVVQEAETLGVRLGIENRDHVYEIPSFEETEELLDLRPGTIEYWHDVGHAERLEHLGFHSHPEWLKTYGSRMIGIHLHDYDGHRDHIAPGLGNVDWGRVAEHLPAEAVRTFEVREFTTPEQFRTAQELLGAAGCLDLDG